MSALEHKTCACPLFQDHHQLHIQPANNNIEQFLDYAIDLSITSSYPLHRILRQHPSSDYLPSIGYCF
jgi:hypothetical protein